MSQHVIFWPMIAHVVLVILLYALLGLRRKEAVTNGGAKVSQFRENLSEPSESLFVRNSLNNQFELPPLFHIACLALFVTGGVGVTVLVMAWLFAASRYVHAFIHVTSNRVRYRQPAFTLGFLLVVLMWGALAVHLAGL